MLCVTQAEEKITQAEAEVIRLTAMVHTHEVEAAHDKTKMTQTEAKATQAAAEVKRLMSLMKDVEARAARAEAKATQAEAKASRLEALLKAEDKTSGLEALMEAEEAKATRADVKAARLAVLMKAEETRARKKRSRDDPEHVGDSRPLSGMQICQKLATEHNVVLKKVKLERDEATSKRDETK